MIKPLDEISLYDVIISMEGIVQTGKIYGTPSEEIRQEMIALGEEYQKIEKMLEQTLKGITLMQMIKK